MAIHYKREWKQGNVLAKDGATENVIDNDPVQVYCKSKLPAVQGGIQHGGKQTRIFESPTFPDLWKSNRHMCSGVSFYQYAFPQLLQGNGGLCSRMPGTTLCM